MDNPWYWFVFKMKAYIKSHKVLASYCSPFQHSTGKEQPVGGLLPTPPPSSRFLRVKADSRLKENFPETKENVHTG